MTPAPSEAATVKPLRLTAELVAEIEAWTAANALARREYFDHPLAWSCRAKHCKCAYMYARRAARYRFDDTPANPNA